MRTDVAFVTQVTIRKDTEDTVHTVHMADIKVGPWTTDRKYTLYPGGKIRSLKGAVDIHDVTPALIHHLIFLIEYNLYSFSFTVENLHLNLFQ